MSDCRECTSSVFMSQHMRNGPIAFETRIAVRKILSELFGVRRNNATAATRLEGPSFWRMRNLVGNNRMLPSKTSVIMHILYPDIHPQDLVPVSR